jgi:hypothetical protein
MAALVTTTQPAREPTVRLYAKHSLPARTLHWLNLVAIGALVASGILIMRSPDPAPLANLPHELFIAGLTQLPRVKGSRFVGFTFSCRAEEPGAAPQRRLDRREYSNRG